MDSAAGIGLFVGVNLGAAAAYFFIRFVALRFATLKTSALIAGLVMLAALVYAGDVEILGIPSILVLMALDLRKSPPIEPASKA